MNECRGDFMTSTMRVTGLSGFDTDTMIEKLMEAEKVKVTKVEKEKQLLLWRQEMYNDLNKDFANFIVNTRKALGLTTVSYTGALLPNTYKNLSWVNKAVSSDTSIATASASSGALAGNYRVRVNQLAEGVNLASASEIANIGEDGRLLNENGEKITSLKFTIYDGQVDKNGDLVAFEVEVANNDNGITMQDVVRAINNAKAGEKGEYSIKIKATYDAANKRLFLQTKDTGEKALLRIDVDSDNEDSNYFINQLNLSAGEKDEFGNPITYQADRLSQGFRGQDAVVDFNGALGIRSSTNTITINGITMNLAATGDFTITVNTDVDGIYEKIKNFVDEYNKLVDKTSELLSQKKYYDYEPLTDEQKKEMSDKDIELWEEKAKSGLLRNDSIVSRTMQNIRSSLYESFDGAYSLITQIGISTEKYSTGGGGKLVIDEEKLKQAIAENPEGVLEMLFKDGSEKSQKGIVTRVYDELIGGMEEIIEKAGTGNNASLYRQVKSNILIDFVTNLGSRSYLDRDIQDFNKRIDELNEKLAERETYYYKQFSALETYINQMNSQSMWLSQQFGGY